jgi:hypothetical protein
MGTGASSTGGRTASNDNHGRHRGRHDGNEDSQ